MSESSSFRLHRTAMAPKASLNKTMSAASRPNSSSLRQLAIWQAAVAINNISQQSFIISPMISIWYECDFMPEIGGNKGIFKDL